MKQRPSGAWRKTYIRMAYSLLVFSAALGPAPLLAQDLHPETMAVLEVLAERLESDPDATYYQIYKELEPSLLEAAKADPPFAPAVSAIHTDAALSESAAYVRGIAELLGYDDDDANKAEIALYAVAAASIHPPGLSLTPSQLDALGEHLAALQVAGIDRDEVLATSADPESAGATYDAAIDQHASGLTPAQLEESSAAQTAAGAAAFAAVFAGAGPGPLPAATVALIVEYDAAGIDLARHGINLSTQPGGPTQEQIDQLNQDIEAWADPLGDIREGLGEWAKPQPSVFEFFRRIAMGPKPEEGDDIPDQCRPINCDCENLTLDIGGAFHHDCLAAEDELIQQCRQTGQVSGSCHPTASGENAFPHP